MKISVLGSPLVKNILSAIAVAVFGFVLLNMVFLFDFLFQSLIDGIIKIFSPVDFNMAYGWFPNGKHALFLAVISWISWRVFNSKLGTLYKAIYLIVPLAVVFVTIGMLLSQWLTAAFFLGGLFTAGILYYFYRTRKPWLYYYTLILVSLAMLIVEILGVEI